MEENNQAKLKDGILASELLKRPGISYGDVEQFMAIDHDIDRYVKEQVEISLKYEGYIKKRTR